MSTTSVPLSFGPRRGGVKKRKPYNLTPVGSTRTRVSAKDGPGPNPRLERRTPMNAKMFLPCFLLLFVWPLPKNPFSLPMRTGQSW